MMERVVAPAVTTRSPRRVRRARAVPAIPGAELWTAAFVPVAGPNGQVVLPAALAEIVRYARHGGGLRVVGVRLALQPDLPGSGPPASIKRVLKHALRTTELRCVDVTCTPAKPLAGKHRACRR